MLKCDLNKLLVKKKITLRELSNKSNIKISTLEKYNNNTIRKLHFSTINKLCKVLECDFNDLFGK